MVHVSNGGFAGYGPGFWGDGHDPFTYKVTGNDEIDMSNVIGALGYHTETGHRTFGGGPGPEEGLGGQRLRPACYIEFICSQYPIYGTMGRQISSHAATGVRFGRPSNHDAKYLFSEDLNDVRKINCLSKRFSQSVCGSRRRAGHPCVSDRG